MPPRNFAPAPEEYILDLIPDAGIEADLDWLFESKQLIYALAVEDWNTTQATGRQPLPGKVKTIVYEHRGGNTPISKHLKKLHRSQIDGVCHECSEALRENFRFWPERRSPLEVDDLFSDPDIFPMSRGASLNRNAGVLTLSLGEKELTVPYNPGASFVNGLAAIPQKLVLRRDPMRTTNRFSAELTMRNDPIRVESAEGVAALDWGEGAWLFYNGGNVINYPGEIRALHKKRDGLSNLKPKGHNARRNLRHKRRAIQHELDRRYKSFYRILARDLFSRHHTVVLEDFRQHCFGHWKSAFGERLSARQWELMIEILRWVARTNGKELHLVNPRNSTRACSNPDCQYIRPTSLPLKIRRWICPECGTEHQRDGNAEQNLLEEYVREKPRQVI